MIENAAPGQPVHCAANPALIASAWCTNCRQPFSGRFLATRPDGRCVCRACAERDSIETIRIHDGRLVDPAVSRGWRAVFVGVTLLPWRPAPWLMNGPLRPAFRFGLACTLAGYAMALGWAFVFSRDELLEVLRAAAEGQTLSDQALLWMPWIGLPFVSALRMLLGAAALHFGARAIAGVPRGAWRIHLRFFALSSVTLLFCAVPAVGPTIAGAVWCAASITMLRQVWGITTMRALGALVPAILTLSLLHPIGAM